jgi:putative redox protein
MHCSIPTGSSLRFEFEKETDKKTRKEAQNMKSKVKMKDGMHFVGELDGFDLPIDADEKVGGQNKGPRPKGLMLTSLIGCTAMDVISILRKMKIEPDDFSVEAESELTDEHPKVFKKVLITYRLKGAGISQEKVEKAVKLSQEKYCGVSAMLKLAVPIEYNIVIE